MKALIKYLLFTCIFLFSGRSFAYAHANHSSISYSSVKNLQQSVNTKSISSGREKENDELTALFVDDDDDESISFKKHVESSNYFNSIFSAQTFDVFSTAVKKSYLSNTSLHRYLIFQAFRI
jgi:hypothetical protein